MKVTIANPSCIPCCGTGRHGGATDTTNAYRCTHCGGTGLHTGYTTVDPSEGEQANPADIITRLMPIADYARKAGINFNPFVDLAKKAFERALEASPDWHGPIDGEMTDEHFDRDERR